MNGLGPENRQYWRFYVLTFAKLWDNQDIVSRIAMCAWKALGASREWRGKNAAFFDEKAGGVAGLAGA